jgi:hypothetical protein
MEPSRRGELGNPAVFLTTSQVRQLEIAYSCNSDRPRANHEFPQLQASRNCQRDSCVGLVDLMVAQSKLKGKLMLCNLNPLVAEVFKMFGHDNRYGHIFPTREDALSAAKS